MVAFMDDAAAQRLVRRLGERFNPWWDGIPPAPTVERDLLLRARELMNSGQAVAILGIRQSGKSTFMRQLVRHLISQGVPPQDIFFANFDEPLLAPYLPAHETLDRLVETYRARQRPTTRPYLFLDEVQNLDHWAGWVRTALEADLATIVLSGSASRLLEPELGSVLTGRTRRVDFGPFSFREFLRALRLEPPDVASEPASSPHMGRALLDYLRRGGLPAAVLERNERDADERLTQYFSDILSRDVVARHGVRSVPALRRVALHLLEQTARPFTFQRLKSLFELGIDQVRHYTDHLVEAHMLGVLEVYDRRPGARLRAPRKVYARDAGLRNAVVARFSEDLGWLAETVVYQTLALTWPGALFSFGGGQVPECDFVLWRGTHAAAAIQVTFGVGPPPERERRGLVAAMRELDLPTGLVLTRDTERDETHDGLTIRYRALWRWLLDPGPEYLGGPLVRSR
ncbi:MAG: hypothetical protein CVU56_26400 [Deltaproteobacteria bacterium HGW-Deltaproteobacteria-14]|jgi:hypothetical protein|nr:MAG: hypothetical protein CVU56_26400 [Deltaproteobacteria bacterium HGW-Deltaproteobacteria-14]